METLRQLTLPADTIRKSNALARAKWSPQSVWEPRIVALVASQIKPSDIDFATYTIPISHIIGDKSDGGKSYSEIERAVENILSRVITINEKDGWSKYNLFSRCRYKKSKNTLEVQIHPDLRSHYLNLGAFYTTYNLLDFHRIPSTYSQRLFEILKSWSDKPEFLIQLSELHECLGTPDSFRKNFKDMRKRVLEPANLHLAKYANLFYKWEPIKTGRAVTHIKFIFSKKRQSEAKKKEDVKTHDNNNDTFKKAFACSQSGKCKETKSKKCAVCVEMGMKKDRG